MKELLWATVALLALLFLTLITLGLRSVPANKIRLGVSNVFEDGLLFGVFAIVFAPAYLTWMGAQSVWFRINPPSALPVQGDDPVWSRKTNRAVVEDAFLAVQRAKINRNPNLAKRFISQDLYKRLRRECSDADKPGENRVHGQVRIKDIIFTDESLDRQHRLCYFNVTVTGAISGAPNNDLNDTESSETEFEAQLQFARALPEVQDAHWQLMSISGL